MTSSSASPSFSSVPISRKPYDVYVSFMPEDTLKIFVEDLYAAFDENGVYVFKEDKALERDNSEISRAIERSSIAIIVFSENSGDSCRCLDEIARIKNCKKEFGQIVYWVEPSEMSIQTAPFAPDFRKIVLNTSGSIKLWKNALMAGGLTVDTAFEGFDPKSVKEIVVEVLLKLRYINKRNEVFLSFCGYDTRRHFVDHLFRALVDKGIRTFRDDRGLTKGESIGPELFKAIDESRAAVVIFSKNYAASGWCLDELVRIKECKKTLGHIIFPVFYDVVPSDVQLQQGDFGKGLANHSEIKEEWREAIKEVASIEPRWDLSSSENWHQAECIKRIVQAIWLQLNP